MRLWRKILPRAAVGGIIALLMALSVFLTMGIHQAFAADGGVTELSLYQRASELTREFATALAPGSGVDHMYMLEASESDDLLVAGNAGGLLGYAEILEDDEGIVGWLMNSYTTASATITYDQLMHVIDNGGDSVYSAGLNNPFFQYAGYGEVLTEMGLVKSIRPGISSAGRIVGTGIVLIVYLLANVAPFLFRGALMILTTLNPFKLFETVLNGTASADLGFISGIAEYVGSMYEAVQDFSIVFLMPLLLVITVFSILVFRKTSVVKGFGRYGLRVFMLFAGLPLIGATYTGLIEDLDSKVSVGSEYADYLVLSSYVDFENWVKYSRLAPPANSDIRNPRYGEDETRSLTDRGLILEVNGTRANNERAEALKDRYSSTSDIGEIFNEGDKKTDVDSETMETDQKSSFSKVYSLLSRHMLSAKYTSSDYDGEVAGQIQKIRAADKSKANDESIVKMYTLSASDNRTWTDKLNIFDGEEEWAKPIKWNGEEEDKEKNSAKGLFTAGNALNELFQFGKYNFNIYNTGNLKYTAGKGYNSPEMPDVVTSKTAPIGSDRAGTVGGLSPIAMYNFLNTTFSNTGLTVYSPDKTSSDLSRDAYAAVTFGGSGVSSVTKWLENVVVMLSLAVLSIAFGIMMVSVAIKNIPRILTGVFGTAFGSIAFITKLLISTAVLIIQVVGMIFLYSLSENIIMTILLNFNDLVDSGGDYFGAGVIFEFLGSFLVIAITAAVTIFMIKNMKTFREMMEEVVTNAINRIMSALDTSTGGQGLDVSKTSGGRVGGDGKLTDAARQPAGGVAGLLGAAHGIEAKREQMLGEKYPNREPDGFGTKLKNRLDTAKDLMGAKGKDVAKGLVGIDGKSYDREMDAKDRSINSKLFNNDDEEVNESSKGASKQENQVNATNAGQTVGKDGELRTDEHGNAIDANGDIISSNAPLGFAGLKPMVAEDGSLLDSDGNTYTDEMGNAFYQNDKGQLIDENGNYAALDNDGVLKPLGMIPGHDGKPVSAMKEAEKLDGMRFDSANYNAMKNAQEATHYGLDKDGNAVGINGEALQVQGAKGLEPAKLDKDGFVTDANGNRVTAGSIAGEVDSRGFEEVEDPKTGESYLRHKGDEAMRNAQLANIPNPSQNLTALAKQSNRANAVAQRANQRVKQLKADGASPYAVMQAERFANKANKNAQMSQKSFQQAMQGSTKGQANGSRKLQPVTQEHVTAAARHASMQQASLTDNIGKLEQLKAQGAPAKEIARQQRKVDAQKQAVSQASNMEQDMRTAQKAGRSYNEVHNARQRVEKAEQVFQNAQNAHAQAVASGQPANVIAAQQQKMNRASKLLSDSHTNMNRVTQKPSGSREQIDRATAQYETAQAKHQQATQNVQRLQNGGTPQEIKAVKQEQQQATKEYKQKQAVSQRATKSLQKLEQNGASAKEISVAKKERQQAQVHAHRAKLKQQQAVEKVQQLQQNVGTPQEIKAAKKQQIQAERKVAQARSAKQKAINPAGWGVRSANGPQVKPVPKVSPNKSYAELTASGVSNYSDYSKRVAKHETDWKNKQSKLKQAQDRLATLRSGERPPQIIAQAEQQVNVLKKDVKSSQAALTNLKENAQGLLKNGSFQPIVASRPIRTNGSAIVNQMVNMSHTQAMYDKLAYQAKSGTITEAGRNQMKTLNSRLTNMRRDLVSSGIKEDSLRDRASIVESTRHMQQSWDTFVDGKSVENEG